MAILEGRQAAGNLLHMRVLDGFDLASASGRHIHVTSKKARGLLAYLALKPNGCETRERLAGLLWSDRSEEHARGSLRQCLKQVRHTFAEIGFTGLQSERQEIVLAIEDFRVDSQAITENLKSGQIDFELAQGHVQPDRILYGYEALDQAFAAWIHVIRQQWRINLIDLLQKILRDGSKQTTLRKSAAEALASIDPTHEEAQRHLIECYALQGNVAAAIRQYNELWELLGDDYDMEPADETQSLIAQVKSGKFDFGERPAVVSASPGVTEAPPLLRLPVIGIEDFFRSDSPKSPHYVVDGFRRELIACLVRFREWIIVEAGVTAENPVEMQNAATSEGAVDYLLEGSYSADQETVWLSITLKDVASRRFIWSERFTLTLDRWFVAQQTLVRRISVALNVYLSAERVARQVAEPDLPLEVYDAWLKGHDLIQHWDPITEQKSEKIFRRIIRQTPDFAPAYSSLSSILNSRHVVFPGLYRSPALQQEAQGFAQRAVEIDPLDTRGQLALAWSYAMRGRFDQAELHYGFAHDLNSNNPTTLISCAHGLAFCGDYDRARELADLAVKINPMMPAFHWGYLVGVLFICKDYEGSVRASELAADVISVLPGLKTAALAHLGRRREAEAAGTYFLNFIRERWKGNSPCTDEAIVAWHLHSFPTKDSDVQERLREGLRLSGLPVPRSSVKQ